MTDERKDDSRTDICSHGGGYTVVRDKPKRAEGLRVFTDDSLMPDFQAQVGVLEKQMSPDRSPLLAGYSAVTLAIAALFCSPQSSAATAKEWSQITAHLDRISTDTGESALHRMNSCGMKFQRGPSWMEALSKDLPNFSALAGDTMIEVFFDAPPSPRTNPEVTKGLVARWVIHGDQFRPENGWAKQIQNAPFPIMWLRC